MTQSGSSTAMLPAGTPPTGRVAVEVADRWRVVAAVVAGLSLVYGGILAWREQSNGAAVAALFGVAIIALVFALAGVVPASVKLGDLEVKLEQAKEQGKQEGALDGLRAAAEIARLPSTEHGTVQSSLAEALSTTAPLSLPSIGVTLQVPVLEKTRAQHHAETITEALLPPPGGQAQRPAVRGTTLEHSGGGDG